MTDNSTKVEQTFALLKDAKQHESQSDFWQATEKFVEAHYLLEALASEETEKATEETERISKLYAAKADEYRKQSRSCLIRAMEQEKKTDEEEKDGSVTAYACTSLDDDQAKARNHAFSVLFSRPIGTTVGAEIAQPGAEPNDDENIENEDDLAARLRALNQSLPSEFKTTSERMSDVNKGLSKLGVSSVYTSQTNHSRFEDELPKDEDEQIDEIIAQAKDEANAQNQQEDSSNHKAKEEDDDDDFFSEDDDDDDDSEQDALLDDEELAIKTIQKRVIKAQVQLAELLALLDQARSKKAKDELDEDEAVYKNDDDSDSDDSLRDVQQHDVAFLLLNGKRKLKSARRNMNKALDEWQDLSLS